MSYILSGYATADDYELREPTWDGEKDYPDESSAQEAAMSWLAAQGPEAQVEMIKLADPSTGDVVAVISQRGIDRC
jgi:hypothetical protein